MNIQSTHLDTKVAVLEERLNVYEQMMSRIDSAIEKISETNQNISKMLAIHEERIEQSAKSDAVIMNMINDAKKNGTKEHLELKSKVDELEKKVEDLFKFKWQAIGVIITSVAVATIISQLAGGILTPRSTSATIQERITTQR
jgi:membrane protease subunit (stomatin/prohibitin family)